MDKKTKFYYDYFTSCNADELFKSFMSAGASDIRELFLDYILENNANVDKALALAVYWTSAPRWQKQYSLAKDSTNPNLWLLLRDLEDKYLAGFYKINKIYSDPKSSWFGENFTTDYLDVTVAEEINPLLMMAVDGDYFDFDIDVADTYDDGLTFDKLDELLEIQR